MRRFSGGGRAVGRRRVRRERGVCAVVASRRARRRSGSGRIRRAAAGGRRRYVAFLFERNARYAETFGRGSERRGNPPCWRSRRSQQCRTRPEATRRDPKRRRTCPVTPRRAVPGADACLFGTDHGRATSSDVERNDDGNDAIVENRSREPPRRDIRRGRRLRTVRDAGGVRGPGTRPIVSTRPRTPRRDCSSRRRGSCARAVAPGQAGRGGVPRAALRTEHPRRTEYAYDTAAGIAINATIRSMSRERSFSRRSPPRRLTRTVRRGVSAAGGALRLGRRPDADARGPGNPRARRRRGRTFPPSRTRKPTGRTSRTRTGSWTRPSVAGLYADGAGGGGRRPRGRGGSRARGSMDDADGRTEGGTVLSRPRATTPTPSSRRRGRLASRRMPRRRRRRAVVAAAARSAGGGRLRVAHRARHAVTDQVLERARHETRAALGRRARTRASTSLFESDESVRIRPRTNASKTDSTNKTRRTPDERGFSFVFLSRRAYEGRRDAARARPRRRFVGHEIKRAVVAVAGVDSYRRGGRRGGRHEPRAPAVAAATEADAATRGREGDSFRERRHDRRSSRSWIRVTGRTHHRLRVGRRRAQSARSGGALRDSPPERNSERVERVDVSATFEKFPSGARAGFEPATDVPGTPGRRRRASRAPRRGESEMGPASPNRRRRDQHVVSSVSGVGGASGDHRIQRSPLPPPPPPPPLVDLFGGDDRG